MVQKVCQITRDNSCHPPSKKKGGFRWDDVRILDDDLNTMMMEIMMMMEIVMIMKGCGGDSRGGGVGRTPGEGGVGRRGSGAGLLGAADSSSAGAGTTDRPGDTCKKSKNA